MYKICVVFKENNKFYKSIKPLVLDLELLEIASF